MLINKKKCAIFSLIILVLLALDQLTKYLAVQHLMNKKPFVILDGIFELSYVENTGAAYGMFGGQRIFFIILTVVLIPLILAFVARVEKVIKNIYESGADKAIAVKMTVLQYVLIVLLAGAFGNFIDRLMNGYVVDFLYFKLIDFPVFNVADCYVTVATIMLLILMIFVIKTEEFELVFPSKEKK